MGSKATFATSFSLSCSSGNVCLRRSSEELLRGFFHMNRNVLIISQQNLQSLVSVTLDKQRPAELKPTDLLFVIDVKTKSCTGNNLLHNALAKM